MILAQIALVPIYLSHWSVTMYGTWLAVQSLASIISSLDYGHHEFLAYEFLRIGRENRPRLSLTIWSGVSIGLLISVAQIVVVFLFLATGALNGLLDKAQTIDADLLHDAGVVLMLQAFVWLLNNSVTGLLFRALAPFGYFPRMAWWNLGSSVVSAIAPVFAVMLGAKLLATGLVVAVATTVFSIPIYIDLFRWLRREQIPFCAPSLRLGLRNFFYSTAVSGKGLLENARQHGVRLVLAPLAGAASLTAFSTMRTGANIAVQGMGTVTQPLMPDLMLFLHQRDQMRSEAAFSTVWFVLVAVLAPAMVVIQSFVEPFYLLWTRGRVPFNPALFASLSLTVLVYALAQPAIAVVRGNNLLRPQLFLSALAAVVVVGGIYLLVPNLGILGGGVALATAEVVAAVGYQIVAHRWLRRNELKWPKQYSFIATTSVLIAALAMGALVLSPQARFIILPVALLLLLGNCWQYWRLLPALIRQHVVRIVGSFPGVRKLYAFGKL
ncbi:lipopolysaccharide biosynthesis protein [Hymenobacter cavernae]|uniref:Polysaccharide biosynthesis protein C-terminal domain-containing protein n=1 Tax=Hymenobacter cavernae TaxID=2044852 RepID=A0ABQ1UA21_9BACT|nr:hypothetical protein [Hymenobacter cavernae]GGF11339.1 hypothetical protein GCM10011383_23190 [Hymenobacter cavernae]